MDRYDRGFKDPQSCKSKAMQIAKEAEHKGMACMPVSVELLTDLVLHVGDQEQRAERAEAELAKEQSVHGLGGETVRQNAIARDALERAEKAEAACSWLRGGLSNAEGMLNRGEKARFVASYCREKLSCTDAGRKYMERLERAEAACARIQEALHLVVGGPMPVTPDSLRELADFMEKQRDE